MHVGLGKQSWEQSVYLGRSHVVSVITRSLSGKWVQRKLDSQTRLKLVTDRINMKIFGLRNAFPCHRVIMKKRKLWLPKLSYLSKDHEGVLILAVGQKSWEL